jgi:enamine deaminase RidA (YjgF/YER057c/UK114 family)
MRFEIVNPELLGTPKGWSNGVVAPSDGRLLFVAGQAGWESDATGLPPDFATQFARALDKVLVVVRTAGGAPMDVARLTIYVTDLAAYREQRRALRDTWRERFGNYYPAMTLVEVSGLVDGGALVEIEATAVLGGGA